MNPFDCPHFDDHEQVTFMSDDEAGLRAIVAIHSSAPLGFAGGGCRLMAYGSSDDALADVLRLSRAMSFKLALADIPAGGAKCVVIADPRRDKTPTLLRALGRAVERLRGRYVIAEDVGTTPDDMKIIAETTSYVVGQTRDTGAPTAYGVFVGLQEAVRRQLGRDRLEGLTVAVQGLGLVGRRLCELLAERGAQLVVCDVDDALASSMQQRLGARVVPPSAIYDAEVDVFSPCALGGVLDDVTIARLRCRVVAGGANNQLALDQHAEALARREILYAPDFVLNMGGVIGASQSGADEEGMRETLERVRVVLGRVLDLSHAQGVTPHVAAMTMAKAKLAERRAMVPG